ncbi:sigS mRNA-stabilizing protein SroA [Staphylococcus massiliensis]|uniref:DUF1659 domain-containing protein n=1 Tax=Staphylococcus massiliensis S46 TaxID=1229783 RepID=K9AFF6_9STAP|nr:hypothetical protein [Staphylococcus massiliensis]EKU46008.1 hypothetical protein C273_10117 [Staphylococcus massiliensis S46]MCG3400276.1 DUF1659 domain-containing protein [Staphylococcus massiliensis]MCG3401906.1 DUF1659 domain-containing protein [Staphylococcus massiliensis]MCG3412432.1 DUF1659 domain-containing protein [Staphylococcus massiliensis]PNZ97578.1 DUF1659 domain-containing protein [Staphylococcus massiliensis CCUG 55927]
MNNIKSLTLVLTQFTVTEDGKTSKAQRRFANLSTKATNEDIKAFVAIISDLTQEKYDQVEVIKSETIL